MLTNVKVTLQSANRYDDVCAYLTKLIESDVDSYEVKPFKNRKGVYKTKISADSVKKEAYRLLTAIESDKFDISLDYLRLINLAQVVRKERDLWMNNYAKLAMYRLEPTSNLDYIENARIFATIESIIDQLPYTDREVIFFLDRGLERRPSEDTRL